MLRCYCTNMYQMLSENSQDRKKNFIFLDLNNSPFFKIGLITAAPVSKSHFKMFDKTINKEITSG